MAGPLDSLLGLGGFFSKPAAAPQLAGINDITGQALGAFNSQLPYINGYDMAANQLNTNYQNEVSGLLPTLRSSLATSGQNAQSLLGGNIPADVQAQIRRSGALQSINGGFGPNSGMAHNLTARDFGLTSLNLMNQGQNMFGQDVNIARSLNPTSADQFMLKPSDFLNPAMQISQSNSAINYSNSLRKTPFDSFLANIPSTLTNAGLAYLTGGTSALGGGGMSGVNYNQPGAAMGAFDSTYGIPSGADPRNSQPQSGGGLGGFQSLLGGF